MMKLKIDPDYKSIFPVLTPEQYTGLERDIIKHGILSPIIVWDGTIIDGHNRYAIAQAHRFSEDQIPTKSIVFNGRPDAVEWIINHQGNRRNLTKSQMVDAWSVYESERAKEAAERLSPGTNQYTERSTSNLMQTNGEKKRNPTTAAEVAKKIGVSENTYRDMKLIRERGTPEQIARMNKGGKGNGVSRIAGEIKGVRTKREKDKRTFCCRKCGNIFPISEAHKRENGRTDNLCKPCHNEETRVANEQKRLEGTEDFYVDAIEAKEWTIQDVVDQLKRDFGSYMDGLRIELDVHKKVIAAHETTVDETLDEFAKQLKKMKGVYK